MNLFQLISDALYNRKLRKGGQERPGETQSVQGWGPDWKPLDPYADEPTPRQRSARLVTTLSQKREVHTEEI